MSDTSPVHLVPPASDEPDPSCIRALENALERAKAGETLACLIVEKGPDGTAGFVYGGQVASYAMLGSLEIAKTCLVNEHLDGEF